MLHWEFSKFKKKIFSHYGLLIKNKHHSKHFQNSWNKYGINVFEYEILELVDDKLNLLNREQYYLDTLLFAKDYIAKINSKFLELGYNINPFSNNRLGTTQSQKSILKSVKNNPNRKEVLQYDFNGVFIKEWESAANAARELNLGKGSIGNCCNNKSEYCSDFIFVFKENLNESVDYLNSLKKQPYVKQPWNKGIRNTTIDKDYEYILFDRYGREIDIFKTQLEIKNQINCTLSNLCNAINNKVIKGHYVFKLSYDYLPLINEIRLESEKIFNLNISGDKVFCYDLFNNFITSFDSVSEASELTELNENSIYNVLCKKRKQLKGYVFKYNDDIV